MILTLLVAVVAAVFATALAAELGLLRRAGIKARRRDHRAAEQAMLAAYQAVNSVSGWRDVLEDTWRELRGMPPHHPEWLTRDLSCADEDAFSAIREHLADLERESS